MKIACLSAFYPLRGGIAQFSGALYRALQKNNDTKAYTFSRQYPNFLFPGSTQYVSNTDNADKINSIELLDSINPLSYVKTANTINQYAPDLLLTAFWMSFFGPSFGYISKKMSPHTKVISILHNAIPHEKKFIDKPFTNYFLKQNDGFVVMSDAVKNDLLKLTDGKAQYIEAPHPIYSHFGTKQNKQEAKNSLGINPDKKTLLFFGIIREYKGLDLLIEAFNQLDNSYQLVIAGESYASFDKFQLQIDKLQFKENIFVFNHYISDDKVPSFFSAADVCILPYKTATQSGITSIAHHFDLPIIATDVGGLKETIIDKKSGLIVPQPIPSQIAENITYYFENSLQEKYSLFIQQELKKTNSWDSFAKKIIDFYNEL